MSSVNSSISSTCPAPRISRAEHPSDHEQPTQKGDTVDSSASRASAEVVNSLDWFHRNVVLRLFRGNVPSDSGSGSQSGTVSSTSPRSDKPNLGSHIPQSLEPSDVERYLRKYERLRSYFPFVPLPQGWTVQQMKQDHPFLLLGILSAMTLHEVTLNVHLHAEFLRVLAERAVTNGEKSLDLIQGILVQIAWYPMHLRPHSRQIFQVLQIAISMIIDLHFNESPNPRELASATVDQDKASFIRMTQAAYLGCYYLSSAIAVCFRRANNLPYSKWAAKCRNEWSYFSGADYGVGQQISAYVMLQQSVEHADMSIRDHQFDQFSAFCAGDSMHKELISVLEYIDPETQQTSSWQLARHYAEMQINAIALSEDFPPDRLSTSPADTQTLRLTLLSRCFKATRAYFDTLLSFHLSEYLNMSFVEWAQLINAVKIMSTLCFRIPSAPQWDDEDARKEARFGMIIESICYRMQELTTTSKVAGDVDGDRAAPDHFFLFKSVLKILREEYDESVSAAKRDSQAASQQRQHGSMCPVLNGSIKKSEYWEALQYSSSIGFGAEPFFGGELGDMDLTAFEGPGLV
ncbi:hypothetical protein NA57DRAFT_79820 [Rhizodiscina lignyota]|uniref:Transcription factor domain-containing protein n=1 Tax=Rhizodiscina lignyota TaxID=1504668 RepID=A0A9P4I5F7_9PEZI|nr:hypothetical protein NA57DRAFT_79820 [Rhizodiscina lignyota]